MKKRIWLLALCFAFVAGFAFADTDTDAETVYDYHFKNDTAARVIEVIPIYAIRPKIDKLKGYDAISLKQSGANTETVVVIYDATTAAGTATAECLGEREAGSKDYKSIGEYWARGKKIVNGIVIAVGAFTEGHIYFVRE